MTPQGHDSFICGTWLLHRCDMTPPIYIHPYDTSSSCIWVYSYTSICLLSFVWHLRAMTPSYVGHDSFICGRMKRRKSLGPWLIHMWDMTYSYMETSLDLWVGHDSLICMTDAKMRLMKRKRSLAVCQCFIRFRRYVWVFLFQCLGFFFECLSSAVCLSSFRLSVVFVCLRLSQCISFQPVCFSFFFKGLSFWICIFESSSVPVFYLFPPASLYFFPRVFFFLYIWV